MMRVPWYVAWPVLLLAAGLALHYLANRALYYPMRHPGGYWGVQAELGAEDVALTAADGTRLHAWMIRRPDARLVTLFLHGNAGNITHRALHAREILAAGSSVLLLDYRGYGKSAGRPTEDGLYADAEAAYQYLLRTGYDPRQIVVHGESLGTAVATYLAARHPCAGMILEAPLTSAGDIAGTVVPYLGPLLVRSFDSTARIARPAVPIPILFLHGDRDDIVPLRFGRALFAQAREPKAFWEISGAGHNDILETAGPRYQQRLREFYEQLTRR